MSVKAEKSEGKSLNGSLPETAAASVAAAAAATTAATAGRWLIKRQQRNEKIALNEMRK